MNEKKIQIEIYQYEKTIFSKENRRKRMRSRDHQTRIQVIEERKTRPIRDTFYCQGMNGGRGGGGGEKEDSGEK